MLPYTKITESTLSLMDNNKYISFQYTDNLNIDVNDEKILNIKLNEDNLNNSLEILKGNNMIFDKNELSVQKVFSFEILPFIGMINNTLSDNYNSNSFLFLYLKIFNKLYKILKNENIKIK